MKVLLISANTEQINMPVLPLGMAYVAAAVENAGHEIKTVNLMMAHDIRGRIQSAVEGFRPEVIGISVRNIDDQMMVRPYSMLDPVKTVVDECRRVSDAIVVLGGAGYSIFPERTLAYLKADMGIQGEGEKAFVRLLERLERKVGFSDIPGLCLAASGIQEKRRLSRDLDDHPQPLPNIHLNLPPSKSEQDIYIPIQTRRGCPMDCSYCSTATIEGRTMRKHSVASAVAFIQQYTEIGFKRFFFVDNTFNFPRSYANALCDRIIETGLHIEWRCILYPWKIDARLVEKMARAGCREVSLGFESGSAEILKRLNKRFGPGDVRRISEMLRSRGILRMGFLLLGGPGETRETVEESFLFADSLEMDAMKITAGVRIYPGTALHGTAVREGLVSRDEDLLFPRFYLAEGMEGWLEETVNRWVEGRPNWRR